MTDDIDHRIRKHLAEQAQQVAPGDLDWVRRRSTQLRVRRGAFATVAACVVVGLSAVGLSALVQSPPTTGLAGDSVTTALLDEVALPTFKVVEVGATLGYPFFHGQFAFDESGCPFLEDPWSGDRRPLYFPEGSTVQGFTEGERRVLGSDGETIVTEGDLFNASLLEYDVLENGACQVSNVAGDPLFADVYGVVVTDDGGPEATEK